MKKLLAFLLFALPALAESPVIGGAVQYVFTAPSGSCGAAPPIEVLFSTGAIFTCDNGTWAQQGGGSGAVSSVTNSDGTVTVSPTTGAVIASLALTHSNVWTALQSFAQGTTAGSTPTALQDWNAYGDSLTFGDYSTPSNSNGYTVQLQALLPGGWTVNNYGIDSETSNQIAVRTGAVPSFATVSGGSIPASTGVTVAFPLGYEPSINNITQAGILAGVPGSVTCTANPGTCTFTRTTSGSAVSVPAPSQFVITPPNINGNLLIWAGHNNQGNPSQVFSNVAQMVSIEPSWGQYLVLSITNDAAVIDWAQNSNGIATLYLNNTFANTYGSHYVDVRSALVTYACGQTDIVDLADCTNGEPATTLRGVGSTTTLNGAINNAVTSITINTPTPGHNSTFQVNDILIVDSGLGTEESMVVTSVSGNTIGVTRAYNVTAQAHSNGATITDYNPTHFGNAGYGIIASTVLTAINALGSVTPVAASQTGDSSGDSQLSSTNLPNCTTGQCALGSPQNPWAGAYFSGPITVGGAVIGGRAGGNFFLPGPVISAANGGPSLAAQMWTGTPYSGGNTTTNFPLLLYDCLGSSQPTTWNIGGTLLGFNTCSGYSGFILDLHVNGAGSSFNISNNGAITSQVGASFTTVTASQLLSSPAFRATGSTFSVSGCGTATSLSGGATAGTFTGASASCTPVVTTGLTSSHGYSCWMNDQTTPAANFHETANSTTTITFTASGTPGSADVINFGCMEF